VGIKIAAAFALFLAIIFGAAWFDSPQPRADLVIVNNGDVSTLDFTQMSWVQDFRAARLLFEGLTASDNMRTSYPTVPAGAQSWEVSADALVYTFHLRPSARWSNGEQVTADDYKFAWMRMLLPENGADYVKLFLKIQGAEAFYQRRVAALKAHAAAPFPNQQARRDAANAAWKAALADFNTTVRIDVPDPLTLRVTLRRPVPYFLSLTSFPAFFPLHRASVQEFQFIDAPTGHLRLDTAWVKPPKLVSNGPFLLSGWRFKREMRAVKNTYYWNASEILLNSISMPTIDDGNAAVLAFRTGAVDWVSDVVPSYRAEMLVAKDRFYQEHADDISRLRSLGLDAIEIDRQLPDDERKHIHAFRAFGTYFYNFNCRPTLADGRPNPFADPRVRRAFAMTINRRGVIDTVRRSGELEAPSLIPPGSIHNYNSPNGLPFDPPAARKLLEAAGFPAAAGFPMVELLFNKDGGHDLIAQYIAKGWQEDLGVNVLLQQKEVKVFREQVKSGNFMVSRGTWFGDYGDPTTFLDIHREGDGNNDRAYASPAFEALMNAAAEEPDAAARLNILTQAETLITEQDLPVAPIFHFVQVYLFDPNRISGISPHPRQEQLLARVRRLDRGHPALPMQP